MKKTLRMIFIRLHELTTFSKGLNFSFEELFMAKKYFHHMESALANLQLLIYRNVIAWFSETILLLKLICTISIITCVQSERFLH